MTDKYVFNVDKTLIVRSWNSNMEKLCRRQAKDVIGKKIDVFFPHLDEKILPVFKSGRKKNIKNYINTCFMGASLKADVRIVPVKNKSNHVNEVCVELDCISGECPLDKKLHDSEKMIEIGKIASSLAHGVRNPLNSIKGAVVYLREKYGHEATFNEFSSIINEEIDKLDGFISSFLGAARKDMRFVAVDLNDILTSIIVMSRPRAKTQNVKIRHDVTKLPTMTLDSFQIEQALFNLINNALEAMPDGGEIRVKTAIKWEKDQDFAVIEISDTGKGIPEKKLKKLGELSDNPEKIDRGFGIFLSREVIKSHNGKLIWESVRDRGTTFKVFLPITQSGQTE